MQDRNIVDDYENTEKLEAITKLDFYLALTDFGFSFKKKEQRSHQKATAQLNLEISLKI